MAAGSPQVILLDFFGTLVGYEADRTKLRYASAWQVLVDVGLGLDHDEFVREWDAASLGVEARLNPDLREHSMLDYLTSFERAHGLELDGDVRDRFLGAFLDEWSAGVVPIDGTAVMLERLQRRCRLAVVSNTHDGRLVPALLDRFGLRGALDLVLLSVEHGFRKPHPSIYQAALDHFACPPDQALFVGDTLDADYLGPVACGIRSLLIDPDRRHPEVADEDRLDSVLGLEGRLSALG
jgi:putative hydrolase of the HAD superfamily